MMAEELALQEFTSEEFVQDLFGFLNQKDSDLFLRYLNVLLVINYRSKHYLERKYLVNHQ